MEKQFEKALRFNMQSRKGMVNIYYALELKFFMYKLFYMNKENRDR